MLFRSNHGIIGHAHAPITIVNGSEKKLTDQEVALLGIFEKLDDINTLPFAHDTTLIAENQEELKALIRKVKGQSEKMILQPALGRTRVMELEKIFKYNDMSNNKNVLSYAKV